MDKQIEEKIIYLLEREFDWKLSSGNSEKSELAKKVRLLNEYRKIWNDLKLDLDFCKSIISTIVDEISNESVITKNEIERIEKERLELLKSAESLFLSNENNSKDNCVVEIRSGAGGDEAKLFTRTILQMYLKFSEKKKWKAEMINSKVDQLGGFSFASFLVKGKKAFSFLKNESGVHRVQRIPETESKGRIQTSTVTVVVFPELDEISIKIEENDLRIDTYKSSGAGGQHVNTTDSAVRITHLPTGISTTSQDGRSQIENRKYAMLTLRSLIHDKYRKNQENEVGEIRSSAIGNSERSEKIRTYNFHQSRVTDHRILFHTGKLESFINGEINELCEKLIEYGENSNNSKALKLKRMELFIGQLEKNGS